MPMEVQTYYHDASEEGCWHACRCLMVGGKYDLKVVFRLVQLWFSLAEDPSVNQIMAKIVQEVPSYKFLILVYQMASRMSAARTGPTSTSGFQVRGSTSHHSYPAYPCQYSKGILLLLQGHVAPCRTPWQRCWNDWPRIIPTTRFTSCMRSRTAIVAATGRPPRTARTSAACSTPWIGTRYRLPAAYLPGWRESLTGAPYEIASVVSADKVHQFALGATPQLLLWFGDASDVDLRCVGKPWCQKWGK